MSIADKLIINAAITGMVPTKQDNPHVPLTPEEIAADVRRCRDAGAAIVHLHARDAAGEPTYQKEIYLDILTRVRQALSGHRALRLHQRQGVQDVRAAQRSAGAG